MLLNLSNHPSASTWDNNQLTIANALYGSITDVDFPIIDPASGLGEIAALANEYCTQLLNIFSAHHTSKINNPGQNAVHIMGEFTFTFALVSLLQKNGISCVASTTRRVATDTENGKVSRFEFVRFREYPEIFRP